MFHIFFDHVSIWIICHMLKPLHWHNQVFYDTYAYDDHLILYDVHIHSNWKVTYHIWYNNMHCGELLNEIWLKHDNQIWCCIDHIHIFHNLHHLYFISLLFYLHIANNLIAYFEMIYTLLYDMRPCFQYKLSGYIYELCYILNI